MPNRLSYFWLQLLADLVQHFRVIILIGDVALNRRAKRTEKSLKLEKNLDCICFILMYCHH